MSKVSSDTAKHYYEHRTPEKVEKYKEQHRESTASRREKAEELEDSRLNREGESSGKVHGNALRGHN